MKSNVSLVTKVLTYTFGLVPILAGLDKFTNILADWSQYVSPGLAGMLPLDSGTLMTAVGAIEILAGILVFTRTRLGAYVVMGWLIAIALVLVSSGKYLDVAVRDLVMAVAAFSLAKLKEG